MSLYADLEQFVQAHGPHGELTWWTTPPTPHELPGPRWLPLFTAVFGSIPNYLNWKALGQETRAANSLNWFVASIIVFLVFYVVAILGVRGIVPGSLALYLIVWYFRGKHAGRPADTQSGACSPGMYYKTGVGCTKIGE